MGRSASTLVRNEAGEKWCPAGAHWVEVKLFHNSARAKDGLASPCFSCHADERLWRKFKMTREQFTQLFKSQNEACAICKCTAPGNIGWSVDHDHACCPTQQTCGKCVRGILCHRCNSALGMMDDDVDIVRNAYEYLAH